MENGLWSGEEGGKRGSDFWTDYWVKEDNPNVEVTNYVNLDMAGVNWPGGGGAPCGGNHGGGEGGCDPQPAVDPDGYPKDEEVWPMRVYIGPSLDHDIMNQPGMVGLAMWIGSDHSLYGGGRGSLQQDGHHGQGRVQVLRQRFSYQGQVWNWL